MRTTIGLAILLTCGVLGVVGAKGRNGPARQKPATPPSGQPFIVHEWGTFTNFSASDGTQLEFRSVIGESLPPFVRYDPLQMLGKGELVARQRMETPVTYFYTDRRRTVDVRVAFPNGSLTEFYPPAETTLARNAFASELGGSSLAWKIKAYPPGELTKTSCKADSPPHLPEVIGDDHYGFARETDSAVVEAIDEAGQKYAEKFLFYRGAGDFSLPIRLEAFSGRRFRATNDSAESIEALFMVTIDDDGLRFVHYPELPTHSALELRVPEWAASADDLGDRMAEALVTAGLYEKEARAMIHTWQSSWFSERGARLFYLVPRRLTDEIIPLRIDPAPDQVVRVLVGRMEALTPETASRLTELANDVGTRLPADAAAPPSELIRLGRFAGPALTYLAAQASDPAMRDAILGLRKMRH